MCNIQLTTCKCATYNLPDRLFSFLRCSTALSSRRRAGCSSTAVSCSRSAPLCSGGPPRPHCSPNTAWQRQRTAWHAVQSADAVGRCAALRCVAATVMARVFAWIVRSLAAAQHSQCHSLRSTAVRLHSAPLAAAAAGRRTIEVNIRNQSHSNVYLLQVSRTAQCRRHMQPAHQRYNLPRTCNSVERPKSCPDTCAKCSPEQLNRNC